MGKSRIQCFWMEPAPAVRVSLRRYGDHDCPLPFGYHNASVVIVDAEPKPLPPMHPKSYEPAVPQDSVPRGDPRWPKACGCGYVFGADDRWQINHDRLYTRSDGGPRVTLRDAPPGAMYDSWWYWEKGADGRCLTVVTPGGPWMIDAAASDGSGAWKRTGEPPNVTARPSILIRGSYHGFLTNGVLEEV